MGGRRRTIEDDRATTNLLSNLLELHVLIFIVDSLQSIVLLLLTSLLSEEKLLCESNPL